VRSFASRCGWGGVGTWGVSACNVSNTHMLWIRTAHCAAAGLCTGLFWHQLSFKRQQQMQHSSGCLRPHPPHTHTRHVVLISFLFPQHSLHHSILCTYSSSLHTPCTPATGSRQPPPPAAAGTDPATAAAAAPEAGAADPSTSTAGASPASKAQDYIDRLRVYNAEQQTPQPSAPTTLASTPPPPPAPAAAAAEPPAPPARPIAPKKAAVGVSNDYVNQLLISMTRPAQPSPSPQPTKKRKRKAKPSPSPQPSTPQEQQQPPVGQTGGALSGDRPAAAIPAAVPAAAAAAQAGGDGFVCPPGIICAQQGSKLCGNGEQFPLLLLLLRQLLPEARYCEGLNPQVIISILIRSGWVTNNMVLHHSLHWLLPYTSTQFFPFCSQDE
jgi:hypothetical protein